jgi:hypothetical protein
LLIIAVLFLLLVLPCSLYTFSHSLCLPPSSPRSCRPSLPYLSRGLHKLAGCQPNIVLWCLDLTVL